MLFTLKIAYREFEERVGQTLSPKGAKTELIRNVIARTIGPFRVADIQREGPGVSLDMIRQVLKKLKASKEVECLGRGQDAHWRKTAKWEMGNTQSNRQ